SPRVTKVAGAVLIAGASVVAALPFPTPARAADDAPTATLSLPASPTRAATITLSVAFSEPILGFESGDIALGGTASGCVVEPPTGSGAAYSIEISGCTEGTVIVEIEADTVTDSQGI